MPVDVIDPMLQRERAHEAVCKVMRADVALRDLCTTNFDGLIGNSASAIANAWAAEQFGMPAANRKWSRFVGSFQAQGDDKQAATLAEVAAIFGGSADGMRRQRNDLAHNARAFWDHFAVFDLGDVSIQLNKQLKPDLARMVAAKERAHLAIETYVPHKARRDVFDTLFEHLDLEIFRLDALSDEAQAKLVELIEETLRSTVRTRVRIRFLSPPERPPATRDWVLGHMIWTGCPPPSAGSASAIALAVLPVQDGDKSGFSDFRPSGHTGTGVRRHRRPPARRRLSDRNDCRSAHRNPRLVRSDLYVRSLGALRRASLDSSSNAPVGPGLRMDGGLWSDQYSPSVIEAHVRYP